MRHSGIGLGLMVVLILCGPVPATAQTTDNDRDVLLRALLEEIRALRASLRTPRYLGG